MTALTFVRGDEIHACRMRPAALALALALAACTPDADNFPVVPVSNVNVVGGMEEDDDFPVRPDAGVIDDGGIVDAELDAGPFFDAPPPDAAALLPDSF